MKSSTATKLRELADKLEDEARAWGTSRTNINARQLRQWADSADEEVANLVYDLEHYGCIGQCHECGCHRRNDELSTDLPERYCDVCVEGARREYREEAGLRSFLNATER